jgi:hypothetical protein
LIVQDSFLAGMTDSVASGRDPARHGSDTGKKDDERFDRFHAPSALNSLELEFVNF